MVAIIFSSITWIVFDKIKNGIGRGVAGPTGLCIFALLTAITTILVVLDDSSIGLLRGDLQLKRNAVFSVSKLMILPILIWVWPSRSGTELVLSWLIGLVISLGTIGRSLWGVTRKQPAHFDFKLLIEKRRLMVGHHSLNLSILAPPLILPIVVVSIVGATADAAYTAAILVVGFVNVIPSHLSTVLFAVAPGDDETLRIEVRKTMRICLALAACTGPFFLVFSGFILGIFGSTYQSATTAMVILGFTTYPSAIKSHYVAIARVRGRMRQAALWTTIGGGLEVGLAASLGAVFGLTGVASGYLAALLIEASLFSPTVFRVLYATPSSESRLANEPSPNPELTNSKDEIAEIRKLIAEEGGSDPHI